MGAVWSLFQGDQQLFDKSAHLRYPSDDAGDVEEDDGYSSKFAFYQTLKQAVARMELTRARRASLAGGGVGTAAAAVGVTRDDGDMEPDDRAHVNFMLAHWPREVDVVYDRHDEFPFTIAVERELDVDSVVRPPERASGQQQLAQMDVSAVTTQEEAILKGLSENKLSSTEAIHQATEQLRDKLGASGGSRDASADDRFLRVLAKYPRAARLYASQQLHARADVERAFRLYVLSEDYARAAHTVGKLAYGEEASRSKKKLQRLRVMSKLLQRSLELPRDRSGGRASIASSDSSVRAAASSSTASTTASATRATTTPPANSSGDPNNLRGCTERARTKAAMSSARARHSFAQAMTDEMVALLQCQSSLQSGLGVEYLVGSSLVETLHKLFALYPTHPAAFGMAVELAEQFEVHPRQFSWSLLKVLAQTEQWQTLLIVTAVARPAIGYTPVIELLLDEDHVNLAHDLLALIDAPQERETIMKLLAAYHAHHNGSGETIDDRDGRKRRGSSNNSLHEDGYYLVENNAGE